MAFNLHGHQNCEICRDLMANGINSDTEEDIKFFTTVCPDDCDHDGRHRGCDHGRHRDCAHEQHHHLLGWAPGTGCSLREVVAKGSVPWIVDCSPLGRWRQQWRAPMLLHWKAVSKSLLGSHCNPELL